MIAILKGWEAAGHMPFGSRHLGVHHFCPGLLEHSATALPLLKRSQGPGPANSWPGARSQSLPSVCRNEYRVFSSHGFKGGSITTGHILVFSTGLKQREAGIRDTFQPLEFSSTAHDPDMLYARPSIPKSQVFRRMRYGLLPTNLFGHDCASDS